MNEFLKNTPLIGPLLNIFKKQNEARKVFKNSAEYWSKRYRRGGTSGLGSYGKLAEFKAEIINDFVKQEKINSVIEFGCGDGNQLKLANYPNYIGFDISKDAISLCDKLFDKDKTKRFALLSQLNEDRAELTLSLDVIYHLLEDDGFHDYMSTLFDTSNRYVIIYSSNKSELIQPIAPHVKHREFTKWIERMRPNWKLIRHIPNRYPYCGDDEEGSFADFYIYQQQKSVLEN